MHRLLAAAIGVVTATASPLLVAPAVPSATAAATFHASSVPAGAPTTIASARLTFCSSFSLVR